MVTQATADDVDQEVINIGSGVETSLPELVRLVRQVTGTKRKRSIIRTKAKALPA